MLIRTVLELRGESCLETGGARRIKKIIDVRALIRHTAEGTGRYPAGALTHFVQNAAGPGSGSTSRLTSAHHHVSVNKPFPQKHRAQRSVSASIEMGATDNMLHLNAAAQRALEKVFKSRI